MSELLTRKKFISEEDWWREGKYEYSQNDGFLILQLSPSPQSFLCYFYFFS